MIPHPTILGILGKALSRVSTTLADIVKREGEISQMHLGCIRDGV